VALILDTGPLYGSLDRTDASHQAIRSLLRDTTEELVIPLPVLVETEQLIRSRLHPGIFTALLDDILIGAYRIEDLTPEDYERVREVCAQYGDSDIGFVDAAVLAIVERLGEPKLATLDHRHFGILRPRHVSALTLLP
jgi:predicted nucleic acid-binding protein